MKKRKLKKLLKVALRQLAEREREPCRPMPAPDGRTLSDWLETFERLLAERQYAPHTVKNHRGSLAHVRRLWGSRPLAELRPHEIATALRTFGPGHTSTARRVLAELRDACAEAVNNGWMDSNPAANVRPPVHRVIRSRLKFETWQAMRTLSQSGPQRWVESMLLLALITGQRRSDLAKMKFDDIVTAEDGHQLLRVEQAKKAGKPIGARIEIPLALRLDAIGMTLADVVEHCRSSARPGPTLLRKIGGGAIEESSLSVRFHETIVAVEGESAYGRYQWPSLHEVRSLSARLYKAEGKDPQRLLGHMHHEMTDLYLNDRGLSAGEWQRVAASAQVPAEI